MKLDKASIAALVKLVAFLTATALATVFLMMLLGNGSFGDRTTYKAVFHDVTGMAKGDDVRIAGVAVGSVREIEIHDRDKALVTFAVDSDHRLTENTHAQIRFRNLVGQRYIALSQGAEGAQSPLKAGATIPDDRTEEALDLDVLLNGFKPVFQALSPDDTNKLAYEIIQTLQGESGSVERLLDRTASLTSTLAERDELIGDVVVNLDDVLDTVGRRDEELGDMIDTLQQFVTGLKQDRNAILDSVDAVSDLTDETSDLLVEGRPALTEDVAQLNRLTARLSTRKNLQRTATSLDILPIKMKKLAASASYGSYFNFYLCDIKGVVELPRIPLLGLQQETKLQIGGDDGLQVGGARCES
jgi:phospholipid/cholesterol/gamma-HCH transport system substrate-binding protein